MSKLIKFNKIEKSVLVRTRNGALLVLLTLLLVGLVGCQLDMSNNGGAEEPISPRPSVESPQRGPLPQLKPTKIESLTTKRLTSCGELRSIVVDSLVENIIGSYVDSQGTFSPANLTSGLLHSIIPRQNITYSRGYSPRETTSFSLDLTATTGDYTYALTDEFLTLYHTWTPNSFYIYYSSPLSRFARTYAQKYKDISHFVDADDSVRFTPFGAPIAKSSSSVVGDLPAEKLTPLGVFLSPEREYLYIVLGFSPSNRAKDSRGPSFEAKELRGLESGIRVIEYHTSYGVVDFKSTSPVKVTDLPGTVKDRFAIGDSAYVLTSYSLQDKLQNWIKQPGNEALAKAVARAHKKLSISAYKTKDEFDALAGNVRFELRPLIDAALTEKELRNLLPKEYNWNGGDFFLAGGALAENPNVVCDDIYATGYDASLRFSVLTRFNAFNNVFTQPSHTSFIGDVGKSVVGDHWVLFYRNIFDYDRFWGKSTSAVVYAFQRPSSNTDPLNYVTALPVEGKIQNSSDIHQSFYNNRLVWVFSNYESESTPPPALVKDGAEDGPSLLYHSTVPDDQKRSINLSALKIDASNSEVRQLVSHMYEGAILGDVNFSYDSSKAYLSFFDQVPKLVSFDLSDPVFPKAGKNPLKLPPFVQYMRGLDRTSLVVITDGSLSGNVLNKSTSLHLVHVDPGTNELSLTTSRSLHEDNEAPGTYLRNGHSIRFIGYQDKKYILVPIEATTRANLLSSSKYERSAKGNIFVGYYIVEISSTGFSVVSKINQYDYFYKKHCALSEDVGGLCLPESPIKGDSVGGFALFSDVDTRYSHLPSYYPRDPQLYFYTFSNYGFFQTDMQHLNTQYLDAGSL